MLYQTTKSHTCLNSKPLQMINLVKLVKPDSEREENKVNILVTVMFSLSHNIFYPSQYKFWFFLFTFILLSANAFHLDLSKILPFSKESTHYQTTNFRLFQIETLCRQQSKIWRKLQRVIQTGRKHCVKRRNFLSNFPLSNSVFKRLVSQARQKVSLCGNGLNIKYTNHDNWWDCLIGW